MLSVSFLIGYIVLKISNNFLYAFISEPKTRICVRPAVGFQNNNERMSVKRGVSSIEFLMVIEDKITEFFVMAG